MTTFLFNLAGLALIGWALMIVLPFWSVTERLVEWTLFPVALCAIYTVGLVAVVRGTGLGLVGDFGSSAGVIGLLSDPDIALVAWIHILAFDHLVAVVIFRDNIRHGVVPLPVQSVLLLLTLMFGPVGFLTYWVTRTVLGPGPAFGAAPAVGGEEAG